MVGITIAFYTLIFVAFFNSLLFSTSFLIAPITLAAAPTLCSISSSHVPSALRIAPKYFMFCTCSISSPSTHTLHSSLLTNHHHFSFPQCIFIPQLLIAFFNSLKFVLFPLLVASRHPQTALYSPQ